MKMELEMVGKEYPCCMYGSISDKGIEMLGVEKVEGEWFFYNVEAHHIWIDNYITSHASEEARGRQHCALPSLERPASDLWSTKRNRLPQKANQHQKDHLTSKGHRDSQGERDRQIPARRSIEWVRLCFCLPELAASLYRLSCAATQASRS